MKKIKEFFSKVETKYGTAGVVVVIAILVFLFVATS